MPVTININGLTLVHKGSEGLVHNTLPDVCRTPKKGKPVPYENEAYSRDLIKGTTTCFADGDHMIANLGSEFAISVFDEPGTLGGIKSGTNMAEADWITHSFDVFFEGKPACRLTDKMFMNHRNTVSLAGEQQECMSEAEFEDWLCELACKCWNQHKADGPEPLSSGQTFQNCVNKQIEAQHYQDGYPRDDANAWREVPFDRGTGWDMIESGSRPGLPTGNPIRPNSRRPDVVHVENGCMQTIYDVKFPTDPTGHGSMPRDRVEDYRDIAERYTGDRENFKEFNIDEKCDGCGDPNLIPVAVGAKEAERGFLDKLGDALFESTGVRLAGAALVAYAVVSVASRAYPPRNAVPLP